MTCCTLLVAVTMLTSNTHMQEGYFGTPMFLRGQPVWVTPISRRTLRMNVSESNLKRSPLPPKTEVATRLA